MQVYIIFWDITESGKAGVMEWVQPNKGTWKALRPGRKYNRTERANVGYTKQEMRVACLCALWTPWGLITARASIALGQYMAGQGTAYLPNLSFVKMERPGQGSPRMTEFRSPPVALSIIQTSALISTSENDGGQTLTAEIRWERRKGSQIVRLTRLKGEVLVTFAASLNGDCDLSLSFSLGILIS